MAWRWGCDRTGPVLGFSVGSGVTRSSLGGDTPEHKTQFIFIWRMVTEFS